MEPGSLGSSLAFLGIWLATVKNWILSYMFYFFKKMKVLISVNGKK